MATSGKTFYRAARLLPFAVRNDVVQLYAFCRKIDDLADEPLAPIAERRCALENIAFSLRDGRSPELRVLGWPFAMNGVMADAAALLVEAAIRDLDQQQPATEADLLAYAFGVAGTVGIMMAEVLHAKPEGYSAAVALGMAMQLSNIARDVAEDFCQDRVYLPAAFVPACSVAAALRQGQYADRAAVQRAINSIVATADHLYEAAYDGIWSLPWRLRWSILAAAMCYRQIGVKVAQNIELSWQQRTVVTGWQKSLLTLQAGARLFLRRSWRRPQDTQLTPLGETAVSYMRQMGMAL